MQGIRDRGRDGEREARTCAHTVCVCPGAVCHAHSCDLQLMKLGCSRVACQINMSPTPRPSFRGTFAPTGRLLTLFTLFLLNSRVAASFLVALLRESSSYHDQCRPASAHFNPLLLLPLPVLPRFRLQDGLIRNKIIVLFARTCF